MDENMKHVREREAGREEEQRGRRRGQGRALKEIGCMDTVGVSYVETEWMVKLQSADFNCVRRRA